MEECLDIGAIEDILNFNSGDDDQEAYSKPGQKALTHGTAVQAQAFLEEQEELEWISNFPPVDEYVLGTQEKHQSPVSVLENSNINNNCSSVMANYCGSLPVPVRARSQRFRKPRRCFADISRQQQFSRNQENAKHRSRTCQHCGADKTPQWRAGPLGPKTLCNACGVRYKSGRLVAEYRPANSPTFSSHLHSNSHRKIIEMRRQKQIGTIAVKPVD